MRKANHPIRTDRINGVDWYIYECEKCGNDVDRLYAYKCVRGTMLCSQCRYEKNADLYKSNKMLINKANRIAKDMMPKEQAAEFARRLRG